MPSAVAALPTPLIRGVTEAVLLATGAAGVLATGAVVLRPTGAAVVALFVARTGRLTFGLVIFFFAFVGFTLSSV